MRSHATHCARLFGVVGMSSSLRGAECNAGSEPQSVSVAKQATPQLLAPSQPQPDEAVVAARRRQRRRTRCLPSRRRPCPCKIDATIPQPMTHPMTDADGELRG